MQAMQPEMKEIKEKYSSKDQKTQQKLQQETMAIISKAWCESDGRLFSVNCSNADFNWFLPCHYQEHVKLQQHANFLWFDLAAPDPILLLPIIAGVTTFIQQKIDDGRQDHNPQMAMMLWMMPIMIVVFAFNFPAALSLYWVVGNLIHDCTNTISIKGPDLKKAKQTGKAGGAKK